MKFLLTNLVRVCLDFRLRVWRYCVPSKLVYLPYFKVPLYNWLKGYKWLWRYPGALPGLVPALLLLHAKTLWREVHWQEDDIVWHECLPNKRLSNSRRRWIEPGKRQSQRSRPRNRPRYSLVCFPLYDLLENLSEVVCDWRPGVYWNLQCYCRYGHLFALPSFRSLQCTDR